MQAEPQTEEGEVSIQFLTARRSVVVDGRRTSISVEDDFWELIHEIAKKYQMGIGELISQINASKLPNQSLCSAIRCRCLEEVRK